jgi:putative restriction endonuclease
VSCREGLPVRVTRGAQHRSPYSPEDGYRYDGLYRVDAFWSERGKSGFLIWRFRLERIGEPTEPVLPSAPAGTAAPGRRQATIQRIVRNSAVAQFVKSLHDHRCQVCGARLATEAGPYAEAAHIRPVGRPHDGPDVPGNVLCLCPNHHVLFDLGGIVVRPDFTVVETLHKEEVGTLRRDPRHPLDPDALAYHRTLFDR